MKPQLLKVITPNKMIFIKGRLVRSPLESIIKSETELSLVKLNLNSQSIKYTLEDYKKPEVKKEEPVKVLAKKPVKAKKKDSEKTTLEKIAEDTE